MTVTVDAPRSAPPVPVPQERTRNASGVRARPYLVLAGICAGAAATIGLWWQNTPSITGWGDWLTNAGRIMGLLAGYGIVVLVALMARIPPLERGVGADRLVRWHARGGRYVVSLVAAHALLITWGYAVTAHTNVVSETSTLLVSYPDVLMATAAGLLLVGVGVASARTARRRMRYETWYLLHLYTYLAVALAFSHQFSTGAEFVDNRPARVVWSAFYAIVGAAIVWYRIVVPVRQSLRHQLRVESVYREGPGVVSVTVRGRDMARLRAQSGHFFRWRFLTRELWWASNPYSLSAPPRSDRLRITVKDFGAHSSSLAHLQPGTRVFAEGPYGALTAGRRRRHKTLLIAGGIGVTPLRALFESLPGDGHDVTLLYRATREADVVLRQELESVARHRGARLYFVTGSRDALGYDPLGRQSLSANVSGLREHDVFVCGPPGMSSTVITELRRAGVPRRQIHHESFEF